MKQNSSTNILKRLFDNLNNPDEIKLVDDEYQYRIKRKKRSKI